MESIALAAECASESPFRLGDVHASEALFRGLLDAAPDAMVIVGNGSRIVFVNAETERLFGYSRGDLLGQPMDVLVPERYRIAWGSDALSGLRRDGTEFGAEVRLSAIETSDGTLAIAAIRDVSERTRARGELLATIGHDLRSPLNAIMGFAELMFNGKVGPISDDHKEYLGDILNSSKHMLRQIDDLLDIDADRCGTTGLRSETLGPGNVAAGGSCDR